MYKISVLLILCLSFNINYSQKKKSSKKITGVTLAKIDNIRAEVSNNNFYLLIVNKEVSNDTIQLKKIQDPKLLLECKITPFTAKGIKLYNLSWLESSSIISPSKTEESSSIYNEIFDVLSKEILISNVQSVIKIKETNFVDKDQSATQTIQKVRNAGFMLNVTNEGDIILKNKTQENKLTYNLTDKKFENVSNVLPKKKKK